MCLHVLYLYIPPLISAFPTWIVWRPAELVKRYLLLTNKPLLHFHILSTALLLLLLFWVCVFLVFLMLELQSLVRRLNIYEWSNRYTLYASISGGFSFSLTKFYFVNKLSEHLHTLTISSWYFPQHLKAVQPQTVRQNHETHLTVPVTFLSSPTHPVQLNQSNCRHLWQLCIMWGYVILFCHSCLTVCCFISLFENINWSI